jgi:hypothetical protein
MLGLDINPGLHHDLVCTKYGAPVEVVRHGVGRAFTGRRVIARGVGMVWRRPDWEIPSLIPNVRGDVCRCTQVGAGGTKVRECPGEVGVSHVPHEALPAQVPAESKSSHVLPSSFGERRAEVAFQSTSLLEHYTIPPPEQSRKWVLWQRLEA